ncbi:hypothetical protein P615_18080 [Brevibacillus laterosporus PE36]|nr:hypothetical protein P615_18080 [Brevibacillus laterosporus PE36]
MLRGISTFSLLNSGLSKKKTVYNNDPRVPIQGCRLPARIGLDPDYNESTKQHINEFLLTSFVFEMTDTYDSLRLSTFNV